MSLNLGCESVARQARKMKKIHEIAGICYCNGLYHRVRPLQSGGEYGAKTAIHAENRNFLLPMDRLFSNMSAIAPPIRAGFSDMTIAAADRLNDGQRDCLRLVLAHHNSKEIARQLGVSPHTVDQRLRTAMRILNVQSRFEAAREFAAIDVDDGYQPLVYQVSDVEPAEESGRLGASIGGGADEQISLIEDGSKVDGNHAGANFESSSIRRQRLPFPRYRGEKNYLNTVERMGWILAIVIGSALSFGGLLAGLEALSRLKG